MSMIDHALVGQATRALLAEGVTVFNAWLLADTESAHAARLLDFMRPPAGAVVLDAGCGIGALAALMRDHRPDLTFKLLNVHREQLSFCPEGMEQIEASFDSIPLPDGSVDVVMFAFSMCHSENWVRTMREARRVLRADGVMFIFDLCRTGEGDNNEQLRQALASEAHTAGQVVEFARVSGFELDEGHFHEPSKHFLRDLMSGDADALELLEGLEPATWRFRRADETAYAIARHDRIAFQFSGGRDSTAALYLLKPYWDRITVYHLDTGDQFPETRAVVAAVEADMGRPVVRIQTDVAAYRDTHGWASDLVPVDNQMPGNLLSGRETKIVGRYQCCADNLMLPMHARMHADGITLLIRGQRDDEYVTPPLRSGDRSDGLEFLYPIQSWTGPQVSEYLKANGLPLAEFYDRGVKRAPECMGCTAWWDEGRLAYMRNWHPEALPDVMRRLIVIRQEINRQYDLLNVAENERIEQ